ncbi:hypothetical protein [Nocardia sp. NPDC005366]|uniref:hypothetical protein n=1 Tax=Nocardia sp. NPDC005366 TaxID=3156878 RepID=UPI0033B4EAB9
MKPRKSTAVLMVVWVATLVLYLFVKPDQPPPIGTGVLVNTSPVATFSDPAGQ